MVQSVPDHFCGVPVGDPNARKYDDSGDILDMLGGSQSGWCNPYLTTFAESL